MTPLIEGNNEKNKMNWRWTMGMAMSILVIWLVVSQLFALLFSDGQHLASAYFFSSIIQVIILFLIPYSITHRMSGSVQQLGFASANPGFLLKKGIGWGLLVYVVSTAISAVISIIFPADRTSQDIVTMLQESTSTAVDFGLIIAVVFLAPICEEVFFRGILFASFRHKLGKWAGVLITSAIFAALHMNIWAFLPIFVGSVMLCLIYDKYKNMWVNILAHGTWNAVSVAILLAAKNQFFL